MLQAIGISPRKTSHFSPNLRQQWYEVSFLSRLLHLAYRRHFATLQDHPPRSTCSCNDQERAILEVKDLPVRELIRRLHIGPVEDAVRLLRGAKTQTPREHLLLRLVHGGKITIVLTRKRYGIADDAKVGKQ